MLRRIFILFVVLSLALSFWTFPAAAKTYTFHIRVTGLIASAEFRSVDETGCIATVVSVSATDGKEKEAGKTDAKEKETGKLESKYLAFVEISQFNTCTGEQVLAAFGSTPLARKEFVMKPQLTQAALNTTVVMDEFFSGATFPVEVNTTWTGVGDASSAEIHEVTTLPGFKNIFHFVSKFRQAQASSTVTGSGINFTPEPAYAARLFNVKNSTVTVIHE